LKDTYDGRVLLLSPVERIKVESEVARVEKVINKLKAKGYSKVFLVGFKTGSVVGCELLERGAPVTGFVGIDMENEYLGANCIRSLGKRRGVKVLDIYTQREELNFRQANLRTQFLHARYEQKVAFGTDGNFRRGEGKIVKYIRNWIR